MSLLKSNSVQIGQSVTATNNFTLSVPSSPDGTIKLARGNSGATTADILTVNASGAITGATITSSTINGGAITSGTAQASTSGTAIDFTGIPSWAKKIIVVVDGVSTTGVSVPIIQLGDAGGIETSGYVAGASDFAAYAAQTAGIPLSRDARAADLLSGSILITILSTASNTWLASGNINADGANAVMSCAGKKSTSATLDRIRITTVGGTDTFDAGTINIMYEG
jgi:hypothetical protein